MVIALQLFALLELLGGVFLLFDAKTSDVSLIGLTPVVTQEHDWASGFVFLAAAVFVASLLFGFAHLVQDTHDIKRRMKVVVSSIEPPQDKTPPAPGMPV